MKGSGRSPIKNTIMSARQGNSRPALFFVQRIIVPLIQPFGVSHGDGAPEPLAYNMPRRLPRHFSQPFFSFPHFYGILFSIIINTQQVPYT